MRSIGFLTENFAFMIDLYNIAKLFLGCKLGEDCTMAWHNKQGKYGEEKVNRYLLDMGTRFWSETGGGDTGNWISCVLTGRFWSWWR